MVAVSLALRMLILIIISTINKVVLWWVIGTAKKKISPEGKLKTRRRGQ